MSARRASVMAVAGVAAVSVLLALLVVWSASIGPSQVFTGDGPARVTRTETSPSDPTDTLPPRQSDIERRRQTPPASNGALQALGYVIVLSLLVLALFLLWKGARRAVDAWRSRRRAPDRPEHVEFDVLEAEQALADEISAGFEHQREVLLTGEPRNAVVAAWSRFEEQAEEAGLPRQRWETSTEFVLRLFEALHADQLAVSTLARLYHEARFSTHELDESFRSEAIAALDQIRLSLVGAERR